MESKPQICFTMKKLLLLIFVALAFYTRAQPYYFPPNGSAAWDTLSPAQLGWCTQRIDTLYRILADYKTKAFIVLKDGKIVMERYFGSFTADSLWYWASAGKTVTAFLAGIAQQEGKLNLNDTTSKYLGAGWTTCPPNKERLITVWNQLTMTTGLDYNVPDQDCKQPTCLKYKADAGTQWYYHNAPYLLLQDVIESASGLTLQQFTSSRLNQKIGTGGVWLDGVFYSRPRAMARFGSLILNKGRWSADTILRDTSYFNQMVNTSQTLNQAYGYLWWLNGKSSYMLPGSAFKFTGKLFPNAPDDLIAALGKNDQKLHIVPSMKLVVVRMGESSDLSPVPVVLDTLIWRELNKIMCKSPSAVQDVFADAGIQLYPNPATGKVTISGLQKEEIESVSITDVQGKVVYSAQQGVTELDLTDVASSLAQSVFYVHITTTRGVLNRKLMLQKQAGL
jgi:CubicO group peptidase (beta-lactamase class C family)